MHLNISSRGRLTHVRNPVGLDAYAQSFPFYVEGKVPSTGKQKTSGGKIQHSGIRRTSKDLHKSHLMAKSGIQRDVQSIADSMESNLTVAESVISRATARKHRVFN